MGLKNVLVWTNPFTYIAGAPLFLGIVLATMFDGVAKKTKKVISKIDFD